MTDEKDPPIIPADYISGVKVIDIGDLRVARGHSRRPPKLCEHREICYDLDERRVYCSQCEKTIDPFDAFTVLVEQFSAKERQLDRREAAIKETEAFTVRSRAAKAVDEVWRGHRSLPACPTCKAPLFPEDFVGDFIPRVSRTLAYERRNKVKS